LSRRILQVAVTTSALAAAAIAWPRGGVVAAALCIALGFAGMKRAATAAAVLIALVVWTGPDVGYRAMSGHSSPAQHRSDAR
jgi:hypothetical protein